MKMNLSLALVLCAKQAYAAIAADGIWTGNDWYDTVNKIGVANGVPFSADASRSR